MSVVWTHKIQAQQGDIYLWRKNMCELIQIIASVLSTSGIITAVFWDETCVKILSALASGVSLFITAYCKQYDLGTLHKKHKEVELEWLELREDFVSILCDIRMERYTYEELLSKRDELLNRKLELSKRTPDASKEAVDQASQCLKMRKDNTFSDEEIDSCLPSEAKKLKQENVR
ncbi:SLATT domain-containing protein [Turicibacter sp. MMM721]|uniref:SLATT domain-containing protein n=2 Tax=Turicibacter bilis TaxID=2735723 RepID=A0ABY5JN99_9FIRM|nr:SLATT domain-containing protein [Turicibacter bilis]UUF06726.1 SLATT domain-containing protein [Turicibacter bilis]